MSPKFLSICHRTYQIIFIRLRVVLDVVKHMSIFSPWEHLEVESTCGLSREIVYTPCRGVLRFPPPLHNNEDLQGNSLGDTHHRAAGYLHDVTLPSAEVHSRVPNQRGA